MRLHDLLQQLRYTTPPDPPGWKGRFFRAIGILLIFGVIFIRFGETIYFSIEYTSTGIIGGLIFDLALLLALASGVFLFFRGKQLLQIARFKTNMSDERPPRVVSSVIPR